MATITLTQSYSNLDNWVGRLFEAPTGTTILTKTATSFVFRYPGAGVEFPNFRVEVTGTGFTYSGNTPISGSMSSVRILDGSGATVLTISNLGTGGIADDLSQFYSNVFGSGFSEGPEPDGKTAWSHLLVGNDVINGTAGDDWRGFAGPNAGNDRFNMGAGDDYVLGSVGNDTIYGGDGYDMLSFQETTWNDGNFAIRGATINVATGVVLDPWGGTERVYSVESFEGSRFNDTFIGGSVQDRFYGLRGRDSFDGGLNSFDGSGNLTDDRRDIVEYRNDYWQGGGLGIIVDLETAFAGGSITGTIRDGFGNLDTVRDIERVYGTRFADTFVGSRVDNVFAGGEGHDSFDGQDGSDTLDFSRWFTDNGPTTGVNVDLTKATGQIINDGFGNTETALRMEEVWGSERGDTIKGSTGDNYVWMNLGADTVSGMGGVDTFEWGSDSEIGQGDRILDFAASGAGADNLAFWVPDFENMTTTLTLVNGTAATQAGVGTFVFNAANDTLYWDKDGLGGAAMRAVAVLPNVNALSASNFELWN